MKGLTLLIGAVLILTAVVFLAQYASAEHCRPFDGPPKNSEDILERHPHSTADDAIGAERNEKGVGSEHRSHVNNELLGLVPITERGAEVESSK